MPQFVRLFIGFALLGLLCSGCSLPQAATEPGVSEDFSSSEVARIAADGVFALDPSGQQFAFERDGLLLTSLDGEPERLLADERPLAVAWSLDGESLAAAFAVDERSRLIIYDRNGVQLSTVSVDGRVTQMAWTPAGELLALSIRLRLFSFGANQKALLLRRNLQGSVDTYPLFDTTIKLQTVTEMGEGLYRLFRFDLAPLGDEIVYTRLFDPPVIQRNIKLFHRHLKTGKQQQVHELPLEFGGGLWTADSENLMISNGNMTFRYNLWQGRTEWQWPLPGRNLAVSRSEETLYLDGHLFRNGALLGKVRNGRAAISGNGRLLLVADREQVYLYAIPSDDTRTVIGADRIDRLLQLREFRSKKLLTVEEYLQARKSLVP